MFGDWGKTHPPNPETRHKGLPSGPDFHELIGFFRDLHGGQQLLRLTMNAIYQQLVGIGDPVTLQDRFSQLTQHTSFDGAKSEPMDQQGSGFPDDCILEDEVLWLEGTFGKVRFQLEERMQPFAKTREDGRAIAEDGEGGFVLCRHGFEFPVLIRGAPEGEGHRHEP